MWDTLRFQGFMSEILRMVSFLGQKFTFFQFPWDNKNFNNYIYIFMLPFSLTFQYNLNYACTLNI